MTDLPNDKRRVPLGEPSESEWKVLLAEPVREVFSKPRTRRHTKAA